jgi:hypothetical protein
MPTVRWQFPGGADFWYDAGHCVSLQLDEAYQRTSGKRSSSPQQAPPLEDFPADAAAMHSAFPGYPALYPFPAGLFRGDHASCGTS